MKQTNSKTKEKHFSLSDCFYHLEPNPAANNCGQIPPLSFKSVLATVVIFQVASIGPVISVMPQLRFKLNETLSYLVVGRWSPTLHHQWQCH